MFSSVNQQWATRWYAFHQIQKKLGREYNLDPCCFKETAKCDNYITPDEDMFSFSGDKLKAEFHLEKVEMFVNPPYGAELSKFVKHVVEMCNEKGVIADVLIPARTDTKLFHEVILPNASAIRFIKGRLIFGSDEYWEDVWEMETLPNGKKNSLFQKHGKMNAAPFPSMVVTFGEGGFLKWDTLEIEK